MQNPYAPGPIGPNLIEPDPLERKARGSAADRAARNHCVRDYRQNNAGIQPVSDCTVTIGCAPAKNMIRIFAFVAGSAILVVFQKIF
jgi:hypothetical protein